MSLLRVPVVNRDQLQALRTLLRMDFAKAMRAALSRDASIPIQCETILRLSDYVSQAEQPLVIVASLMQFHGTPTAMLPLDPQRFTFFSKLLSIPLDSSSFPGVDPETLEAVLAPLRGLTTELRTLFENAGHLDEEALRAKLKATAPTDGMMN